MTGVSAPGRVDFAQSVGLTLSHATIRVADAAAAAAVLTTGYGFRAAGSAAPGTDVVGARSLALRQGRSTLVLAEGADRTDPSGSYVAAHGDGVADIAFMVADAEAAFAMAVANGARGVQRPARCPDTGTATSAITGFGDVTHTFVQAGPDGPAGLPPGFRAPRPADEADPGVGLDAIDHFAVCLPSGRLDDTVAFYRDVLGFRQIFDERIAVGDQAMLSTVVQDPAGSVTLTLIESDPDARPGQIDAFVEQHGGAGVQHIAFATKDIVAAVRTMQARGVQFLDAPEAYYRQLLARIPLIGHDPDDLRALGVLADQDHDGQLFQIFTRSTHPRRTLFFEVIERLGARTFGSGNIKALYEAVEAERACQVDG